MPSPAGFPHGGHAATMLALAHGFPLVMVHMHPLLGQRMVRKAVQAAGVGLLARASSPKEEAAWEVCHGWTHRISRTVGSAGGCKIGTPKVPGAGPAAG